MWALLTCHCPIHEASQKMACAEELQLCRSRQLALCMTDADAPPGFRQHSNHRAGYSNMMNSWLIHADHLPGLRQSRTHRPCQSNIMTDRLVYCRSSSWTQTMSHSRTHRPCLRRVSMWTRGRCCGRITGPPLPPPTCSASCPGCPCPPPLLRVARWCSTKAGLIHSAQSSSLDIHFFHIA